MQVNVSATLASSTEIAAGTFAFDRIASPGRLVAPRVGRVTDSCWGSYWISVDFDVVVTTLVWNCFTGQKVTKVFRGGWVVQAVR